MGITKEKMSQNDMHQYCICEWCVWQEEGNLLFFPLSLSSLTSRQQLTTNWGNKDSKNYYRKLAWWWGQSVNFSLFLLLLIKSKSERRENQGDGKTKRREEQVPSPWLDFALSTIDETKLMLLNIKERKMYAVCTKSCVRRCVLRMKKEERKTQIVLLKKDKSRWWEEGKENRDSLFRSRDRR